MLKNLPPKEGADAIRPDLVEARLVDMVPVISRRKRQNMPVDSIITTIITSFVTIAATSNFGTSNWKNSTSQEPAPRQTTEMHPARRSTRSRSR